MNIGQVIHFLETIAPPALQESYDNAGLLTGDASWSCKGILCALDATPEVVEEAIQKGLNCIVAHHPIIFGGLKKITGRDYVERAVILAIKHDIAIYAIHTNLDNVLTGVNGRMADRLGLTNRKVLLPKPGLLMKLNCFVPVSHLENLRSAIFVAGAGNIGKYSDCSFSAEGTGTFKAAEGANPFVGEIGKLHEEKEFRLEAVFPSYLLTKVLTAMHENHPYEEVAYDVVGLSNPLPDTGSGLVGDLPHAMTEQSFLELLKSEFNLSVVRHTPLTGKAVKRVALCGGSGSFLIPNALRSGSQFYVTSDVKYHEFFDADGGIVVADIGHYESEQFTIDLLQQVLQQKFHNFAVLKTGAITNPINYYF